MQHLVTNWHVDRHSAGEWETIWQEMHELARQTPGFLQARLLRSVEHPGKFVVYALWASREAWDVYYGLPRMHELTHASFRLLKGPPIQEWFDVVADVAAEGVTPALPQSG
ncbi:MAG TPA: antibiotic biosynthesis monooxygenase family protein [Dehalococcoidia bacterium]|nr:antibiotic biosynthesis monooxygenase family protein [Dehalococcoidia bacterium]